MDNLRNIRVMIVASPTSPLGTIPTRNGYDIRCSQLFLTLTQLDLVEKVFTLEIIGEQKMPKSFVFSKYIPCIIQISNIDLKIIKRNYRILNYVIFTKAFFKVILSRKFWAYFRASDFIFVENMYTMFPLILFIEIFSRFLNKRIILEMHDVFSFGKKISSLIRVFAILVEKILMSLPSWIVCVTYEEAKYLNEYFGKKNISIIPTSTLFFETGHPVANAFNIKTKLIWLLHDCKHYKLVTFMGDLRTPVNKPAVDYIVKVCAPLLSNLRKDIVFVIVGRGYELWKKKDVPENVIFLGYLNLDELQFLLAKSDVCIAPMIYNTGFKSKVISYILAKKPVVLTKEAALSLPLQYLPSLVVTSLENFPFEIINVIDNKDIFLKKAEISYNYFLNNFGFEKFKNEYYKLINILMNIYYQ
jgi:glycosyltransferase involved in cell wall biosynthesis